MSEKEQPEAKRGTTENIVVVGEGVMMVDGDASNRVEEDCGRFSEQVDIQDGHDVGEDEDDEPIDAILCPVAPGAAPPLNCARYWVRLKISRS